MLQTQTVEPRTLELLRKLQKDCSASCGHDKLQPYIIHIKLFELEPASTCFVRNKFPPTRNFTH